MFQFWQYTCGLLQCYSRPQCKCCTIIDIVSRLTRALSTSKESLPLKVGLQKIKEEETHGSRFSKSDFVQIKESGWELGTGADISLRSPQAAVFGQRAAAGRKAVFVTSALAKYPDKWCIVSKKYQNLGLG